jgi:hypothetical protein
MMGQERKILKQFDKDGDKVLNQEERKAAREFLKKEGGGRGGRGGFGPPPGGFGRGNQTPPKPGMRVSLASAKSYPNAELYDPKVLRTLFIDFENTDWEAELQDFHGTDVEVPATLTVDGKKYNGVGVHFRGMSSYMMISAGYKRSLNLSMDLIDSKQRLYGYKTLNLLNAHEDPSFLNPVLYSYIAREHIPTPKANVVKVVINGENWGIYNNVQQFDKIFLQENFKSSKGTRWKVKGSPMARGGLGYIGEDIAPYKRIYEMKSGDNDAAWRALVNLCKTLSTTPPDRLEEALKPLIDVDSLLWFLALDVSLINCDGYWIRSSDYSIYLDENNKFHIIPHDMNEAFRRPGGPGFGPPPGGFGGGRPGGGFPPPGDFGFPPPGDFPPGGDFPPPPPNANGGRPNGNRPPRGGRGGFGGGMQVRGVELDPLVGLDDPTKPLRSKVLAVPAFQKRYLQNVRAIAEQLNWSRLGPVVAQFRAMIEKEIQADTRKLESYEDFLETTSPVAPQQQNPPPRGQRKPMSLRAFADQRRNYLLNYTPKKASP